MGFLDQILLFLFHNYSSPIRILFSTLFLFLEMRSSLRLPDHCPAACFSNFLHIVRITNFCQINNLFLDNPLEIVGAKELALDEVQRVVEECKEYLNTCIT